MYKSEIQADIASIENDASIYDEKNFVQRTSTIDFIDFHILDRIESLQNAEETAQLKLLAHRAKKVKQALEDLDIKLFKRLRDEIRAKIPFADIIRQYIDPHTINNQLNEPGYDSLDNFTNNLFCFAPLPEATVTREDDMVFYQQTPARIIFQLAEMAQLQPDDVFFDIGSGLGQVGMLINLLTGAKTVGIEYEPAYCDYAKECAAQLNLTHAEFINADARKADYYNGTIFFMYTPFEGTLLKQMLDLLQQHAKSKSTRIFTYGPCSTVIAQEPWLKCINGDGNNVYKLYQFRNVPLQ